MKDWKFLPHTFKRALNNQFRSTQVNKSERYPSGANKQFNMFARNDGNLTFILKAK